MGLRDIGKVTDTTDVTLYHPATSETLRNTDGTEMTVTVYGPYSARYKEIERAQQNRRFTRASKSGRGTMTLTAEQLESETTDLLVKCVKDWNLTLADAPEEFSEEAVRATFEEFPWVREQVTAVFGDVSAFLAPSKKT